MVDIQTISIAIASASVVAGIVYYAFQVRHQIKLRQTDLIMRLYSTWGSDEYLEALSKFMTTEFKDYSDFKKKYVTSPTGFSEKPEFIASNKIGAFFQGIGVLLQMKLIDISLAKRLFGRSTMYTWEKMKPIVEGYRKEGYPQIFADFEYLYNEMKKRENQVQQEGVKNG
jgi:hypothetical protein